MSSWTLGRTPSSTDTWKSVCYGNGKFVAVSDNFKIMVSSNNGASWEYATTVPITTSPWSSVCYGNGIFVVVSNLILNNQISGSIMTSSDGNTWYARNAPSNNTGNWVSICYADHPTYGMFLAIAFDFKSMYSIDGIEWYYQIMPGSLANRQTKLNTICYGNNLFIALGSEQTCILTATFNEPFGINTWATQIRNGVALIWKYLTEIILNNTGFSYWFFGQNYLSICYGNGVFVAVSSFTMISIDGLNWIPIEDGEDSNNIFFTYNNILRRSICFGEGLFVAAAFTESFQVPFSKNIMTSTNGMDWTLQNTPFNKPWTSVCYGGGYFVAVSNAGTGPTQAMFSRLPPSPPPTSWIIRASPHNKLWSSIFYGNGLFVAVSNDEYVMTSKTGLTDWELYQCPRGNWTSVCYGTPIINSVVVPTFVAVSYTDNYYSIMTSSNGITWRSRSPPENNPSRWTSVCYGNDKFVAANDMSGNTATVAFMTSIDGITWTSGNVPTNNKSWKNICFGNNLFVACATSGNYAHFAVSQNGTNWNVHINRYFNGGSINAICYGNGIFVAILTDVGVVLTSSNVTYASSTWTPRILAASLQITWQSVCFAEGLFVAVSKTGTGNRIMTSPDGITWTGQYASANNAWQSVCYGAFSFVAVSNRGYGTRVMTLESPSISCYLIGTKILCFVDNEEIYVPIEDIRKGTLVKTLLHGYLPVKLIGKRTYINNPQDPLHCVFKMKETGLTVSGSHIILVDELPSHLPLKYEFYTKNHKIDDKFILIACDSDLFEPVADNNEYTLYHLCLESESADDHFGIWAEGVLSESTSENDYISTYYVNTG